MPFTSETADLKHYPGTTKQDAERGYVVLDQEDEPETGKEAEEAGE